MAGFEVTTYGRFCGDHRGRKVSDVPYEVDALCELGR